MNGVLLGVAFTALACAEAPPRPRRATPQVPVDAGHSPAVQDAGPPPPAVQDAPPLQLDIGPEAALNRGGRVAAAFDLVIGKTPASSLPVHATEPDRSLDVNLRDRIAPVPRFAVDVEARLLAIARAGGPGALDLAVVSRVMRRHGSQVRFCIESNARDANLRGRLLVVLTIDPAGSVSSAVAQGLTDAPRLATCVQNTLRRWVFPEPRGGAVTISSGYDIRLVPRH